MSLSCFQDKMSLKAGQAFMLDSEIIHMEEVKPLSLDEIRAYLTASEGLRFEGCSRKETYRWVQTMLVRHVYHRLGKRDRGVLRDYMRKLTGDAPDHTVCGNG